MECGLVNYKDKGKKIKEKGKRIKEKIFIGGRGNEIDK